MTSNSGSAGLVVKGLEAPGTYTVRAAFGAVFQAVSYTVKNHTYQVNLVSQPANNAIPYVSSSTPFAVQVLEDGTAPAAGVVVQLTGVLGQVSFDACGDRSCALTTDGNGMISTTVTTLAAGTIVLNAIYNSVTLTTSFTSQGVADSFRIVEQPGPAGLLVGATQVLIAQLIGADGVTGLDQQRLYYTVLSGPFAFTSCTALTCMSPTCCDGIGAISGVAYGAGAVTVQVAYGDVTKLIQFTAVALPDVLKLVTGPASGGYAGQAEAIPFAVQAFFNDGVTPVSGRSVTVSVTNGQAGLVACGGAASCVLTADASGMVSTLVTPLAAGSVTVAAVDGGVSVASSFTAVARPDTMTMTASPAANTFVGTATTFAVRVIEGDGVTPRVGVSVVFSSTAGMVQFGGCGGSSCSVATGADGTASVTVTALSAGVIALQAVDGSLVQTVSFTATVRPDMLSVLSVPANGAWVGLAAANAFSVRLMQGDGITPDAGKAISLAAVGGTLGACGGFGCALVTDANGMVSTTVTPSVAGTVALTASGNGLTATAGFTAGLRPDILSVVSVPANGTLVGSVAANGFSVRLMQGDGITPDAGKSVTITATGASLGACGASSCALITDPSGAVSTTVTPLQAGVIALQAVDGALVQTASFTAMRPDTLSVMSLPANGTLVGSASTTLFSVRLMQGDGVTPDAGKTITLSSVGASLGACGAASCALVTDASGMVATAVTANIVGTVTLTASGDGLTAQASFSSAPRPDSLSVVGVPANGTLVGSAAANAFSVRLMQGDGITPDAGKSVTITATGATLGVCGAASCTVITDANGLASTTVTPMAPGVILLQAVDGSLLQTASFTSVRPDTLSVVSLPANGTLLGSASASLFSVRLLQGDGVTPDAGKTITLAAVGATLGACGAANCGLVTDANGMASTTVTPNVAGSIVLTASGNGLTATAGFTASLRPDVLSVVSLPANGSLVGSVAANAFSVRLMQGDGVTPDAGKTVTITATGAALGACGASSCALVTDVSGTVLTMVTPQVGGTIALQAVDGALIQTASFTAVRPDTLSVVSAPGNGAWLGLAAANAFSVRLMQGDGVTPDAGKTITLSSAGATLGGCGAAGCALVTDANGMVSTTVTPNVAGTVALTASGNGLTAMVTFTAANRPDGMQIVSAPANGALVGDVAAGFLTAQVLAGDGITPVVGRSVTVSVINGLATLAACGVASCTLVTDVHGEVSTGLTPLACGLVGLTVSEGSGGAAAQTVTFTAKAKPDLASIANTPGASVLAGVGAGSPLAVKVVLADGVTPVAGIGVTFTAASGNGGTVSFGGCAGSSCVVSTGANGVASATVSGGAAGDVTLIATVNLPSGLVTLTAPFTVLPNRYALTTPNAVAYVAEGAMVPLTLRATAMENGSASVEQTVQWTGGNGFALAATNTLTDGFGVTTEQALLGPLAGGAQAAVTACAWTNVCVSFHANGVAAGDLQALILIGAQQGATGGAVFSPVTMEVVDGGGHPVAGAAVSVYQTVTALDVACPAQGRCPAAAVLASKVTVVDSAADGTVTVMPLSVSGVATSTEIAVSVGTQGFATTVLTSQP